MRETCQVSRSSELFLTVIPSFFVGLNCSIEDFRLHTDYTGLLIIVDNSNRN